MDVAKDVWSRRKKKKQDRLPEAKGALNEADVGNLMVVDEPVEPPRVSLIRRVSIF